MDEYYYLLEIKSKWCSRCPVEERLDGFPENITIPKYSENKKVVFDTLRPYTEQKRWQVEKICKFIGNQKGYSEPYLLLFEDAARLNSNAASISINLQRRMKIGYARAERIMDELEAAGIVGSSKGSKTRDVLLDSESQLEAYL